MFDGFMLLVWIIAPFYIWGLIELAWAVHNAPYISDDHPDALTSMDRRERGLR